MAWLGSVGLIALLVLAGCSVHVEPARTGTAGKECQDVDLAELETQTHLPPEVPAYEGSGRFSIDPSEPVLTPGQNLTLTISFTNPDCRTFTWLQPIANCGNSLIRIGSRPLFLYANGPSPQMALLSIFSCGVAMTAEAQALERDETFTHATSWNGSIPFWDHRSVEGGTEWQERWYWAAAGEWPLSYGFDHWVRYPVAVDTTLRVEENALNRDSPLRPGICRTLSSKEGATVTRVEFSSSHARAAIGTNVTFYANYTLTLPAPGCFLFSGAPSIRLTFADTEPSRSLADHCGTIHPFNVLIQAATTQVVGRIEQSWDGRRSSRLGCHAAASEGVATVHFNPGGLPAPRDLPTGAFEWLPEEPRA